MSMTHHNSWCNCSWRPRRRAAAPRLCALRGVDSWGWSHPCGSPPPPPLTTQTARNLPQTRHKYIHYILVVKHIAGSYLIREHDNHVNFQTMWKRSVISQPPDSWWRHLHNWLTAAAHRVCCRWLILYKAWSWDRGSPVSAAGPWAGWSAARADPGAGRRRAWRLWRTSRSRPSWTSTGTAAVRSTNTQQSWL